MLILLLLLATVLVSFVLGILYAKLCNVFFEGEPIDGGIQAEITTENDRHNSSGTPTKLRTTQIDAALVGD